MPVSATRSVARVVGVSTDRATLHLELRSGESATADGFEDGEFDVGDVIYIIREDDTSRIEHAHADMWPEPKWIGVIQHLKKRVAVVEGPRGSVVLKVKKGLKVHPGNTVEASDRLVSRKISDSPLPRAGLDDFASIDQYIVPIDKSLAFSDFGGSPEIIARARELIELPLERRDLFEQIGARPIKGVLFSGPPGTGKTLLAKIIASRANAQFYSIQAPEIAQKYFGQSERILREVFEHASKQDRAIVFFDELDAIGQKRTGESHEASKRVVAQLLSLMDGFGSSSNVLVIGTTNRKQDLDEALIRAGRFDWNISFELPDIASRLAILQSSGKGITTAGELRLSDLSSRAVGWNGAELAGLWSEAQILAVKDKRGYINADDLAESFNRVSKNRDTRAD